jgi:phosphopantetheine adenylyltransferase
VREHREFLVSRATHPSFSHHFISHSLDLHGLTAEKQDKRVEKGWPPLEVFEVGVLDAQPGAEDEGDGTGAAGVAQDTFESKISSTKIRQRLVEAKGGN